MLCFFIIRDMRCLKTFRIYTVIALGYGNACSSSEIISDRDVTLSPMF